MAMNAQERRREILSCLNASQAPISAAALAERAKKGIIPREPRKGFYRIYTENANSAMQGGGLEK